MKLSREERSVLTEWWFSVDRLMLGAVFLLMISGLLISLSASSPPIAAQKGLEAFYFAKRQALFFIPSLALMLSISLLEVKQIRRLSLFIFIIGIALMGLVLFMGEEINGAKRWLKVASFSLQPSEFVKPAFVVLTAWLFAQRLSRPDMPATFFSILMYLILVGLLVLQPDIGQAFLVTLVWGILFFLVGLPLFWVGLLMGAGAIALVIAYFSLPHVASRIDKFINPEVGDSFQIKKALQSFENGGWFGLGPGEGKLKHSLPDSHTDFIFAVVAEEFGIIACLILLILFSFVVIRVFLKATKDPDGFTRLALVGLITLFGLQAIINMAVNLALLPAKGMTLPFISYGGSSLMATAITIGMILGLMRSRSGYLI